MSAARKAEVFDFVRRRIEAGIPPTVREIGEHMQVSHVMAWQYVEQLIAEGCLRRAKRGKRLELPDHVDLTIVGTQELQAELARRGETFDALDEPRTFLGRGRVCAANHCTSLVQRGHLMCRPHWFALPVEMRSDIMNAWSARQMQAYQEAVERARDHLGGFTTVVKRVA